METDTQQHITPRPASQDPASKNNVLISKLVVQNDYFTTTTKPAAAKLAAPSVITQVPAATTTIAPSVTANVPHGKPRPTTNTTTTTATTSVLNNNYFHPSTPATAESSPSLSSILKKQVIGDVGGIQSQVVENDVQQESASLTSTTAEQSSSSMTSSNSSSSLSQLQQQPPQHLLQPNRHRSPYLIAFDIVKHFFEGFRHGVAFWATIQVFIRSEKLRTLFWKCFVLNGCIFLGSIAILEYFTAPLVNEQLQSHSHHVQAFLFNLFFKGFYNILWLYPLYSLSFILSNLWYNDIAEETYRVTKKTATTQFSYKLLIQMLTDLIYRLFVVTFFLVQNAIFGFIPYVGGVLSFLMVAWLYAFYSFEYAWSKDESLLRRCSRFERNWAYFAGFGTPNALMTFFFPFFINNGLWALLFPVFIVQAIVASPPKARSDLPRIPVFWVSRVLSELVLKFVSWLLNRPGTARAPTPRRRVTSTTSTSATTVRTISSSSSSSLSSSALRKKHHTVQ